MTRRAPGNQDLKIFAVSVIVQKETGGNLVEILEKIAETIRSRYRFYGKLRGPDRRGAHVGLRARGAAVRHGAALLAVLNPTLHRPGCSRRPSASASCCYAVISWLLGLLWLRQMMKVEL